jgi:hypothetical protein
MDIQITTIEPYDILCGRCSTAFNNVGNRRFRVTVSLNVPRYVNAPSRNAKSHVIISIIKMLQDIGARFLQRQGGFYIELNEKQARAKVGHAMRDMFYTSPVVAMTKPKRQPQASTPKSMPAEEERDLGLLNCLDSFLTLCQDEDDLWFDQIQIPFSTVAEKA